MSKLKEITKQNMEIDKGFKIPPFIQLRNTKHKTRLDMELVDEEFIISIKGKDEESHAHFEKDFFIKEMNIFLLQIQSKTP